MKLVNEIKNLIEAVDGKELKAELLKNKNIQAVDTEKGKLIAIVSPEMKHKFLADIKKSKLMNQSANWVDSAGKTIKFYFDVK